MMKNFMFIILLSLNLTPTFSWADDSTLELVSVKPDVVFTPKGFDSNDNVQIVLYGKFHDICHKIAPAKFSVDRIKHKIFVENQAYTTQMCAAIYVSLPYTEVLSLGTLPKADYEIFVLDENGKSTSAGTLPVAQAKNPDANDNYIYARIDEAQITNTSDQNTVQILLKGTLSNTCLRLKEVRTSLTEGNVYDVLPMMTMSGSNCEPANTPFDTTVILNHLPNAPLLVNIRSMGGQSIEKVVDFDGILGVKR